MNEASDSMIYYVLKSTCQFYKYLRLHILGGTLTNYTRQAYGVGKALITIKVRKVRKIVTKLGK